MTSFTGKLGYSVEIIADRSIKEVKYNKTLIKMPNKTLYKIKLENITKNNCVAIIYIDNQKIGAWNISPYSTNLVDRPMNVNKKLYFAKGEYNKLTDPKENIGKYKNTIVKVEFLPELDEGIHWFVPKPCLDIVKKEPYKIHVNKYHGIIDDINKTSFLKYPFSNPSVIPDPHIENTNSHIKKINIERDKNISDKIVKEAILIVDEEYSKPFIKKTEEQYIENMTNMVVDPKKIPKVRHYEDYFLINRYNPYH